MSPARVDFLYCEKQNSNCCGLTWRYSPISAQWASAFHDMYSKYHAAVPATPILEWYRIRTGNKLVLKYSLSHTKKKKAMILSAVTTLIVEIFPLLETYQKYKQSTQYCLYKSFTRISQRHGRLWEIWGNWEEKAVLHEEAMLAGGSTIFLHFQGRDHNIFTFQSIAPTTIFCGRHTGVTGIWGKQLK